MIERLDPETRIKFDKGELSLDDLQGMGLIPESDYGDEEGEFDQDDLSEQSKDSENKR